jgi:hypothetical protein
MWPCEIHRKARAVQFERELEKRLHRPSRQLAAAAAMPEPPLPALWLKIPLEGQAECFFTAQTMDDALRVADWAKEGPYADAWDEIVFAMQRDRRLP